MKILVTLNLCNGYYRSLSPLCCHKFQQIYQNIVDKSKEYDLTIIVNDLHSPSDGEFSFLPQHCIKNTHDCLIFPYYESKFQSKILKLTKNTLSAFKSKHNIGILENFKPKEIIVAGFSTSIDVIPTILDLLQLGYKISFYESLTDDLCEEYKRTAISYISKFIEIKQ